MMPDHQVGSRRVEFHTSDAKNVTTAATVEDVDPVDKGPVRVSLDEVKGDARRHDFFAYFEGLARVP